MGVPYTAAPGSSDASHAPPSPTASSCSATSSLSHSSRYSSSDRPYSFIPAPTTDPALNGEGVYEDTDPFAKGAVRVVHRSCEALPSTYSYHSTNNYSSYAASPRGAGRRAELSGEAEVDGFAPTQFVVGKDEEQEIDDSGIFLTEDFVPARSFTPPPSSPSSAADSPNGSSSPPQRTAGLARAPTARTYPIAASPSRNGRTARTRARLGSPFPLSRSLSASASAAGAAMQGDYVR
ncbi:hypothetical protein B0H14DRAFT_3665955 [Mycena olivaceomarginata]|nr:hypothetical protein B0H14DRAFT_3665955 [Mycena olivaceomarginata]